MFGAAVSSRLAWKHGPMKFSSLGSKITKMFYENEKAKNRDSPLNIRPLGEVLFKLGEIDWHVGRNESRIDE